MAIDQGFDRLFNESPNVANPAEFIDPKAGQASSNDRPALLPAIAATVFVAVMIGALHMTDRAAVPASVTAIPEKAAPVKPTPAVRIVGTPYVVTPHTP